MKKICFFGSYDRKYSRNKINLEGLKLNNVDVIECEVSKPIFKVENILSIIKFVLIFPFQFLYRTLFLVYRGYIFFKKYSYDVIFIGYPGLLELIPAYFLKRIINRPIIFDGLTSQYEILVLDRKLVKGLVFKKLLLNIEKFLYKIPDCILVDTDADAKFFIDTFGLSTKKIKVLPIGAEDKLYKPSERSAHDKNFIVMFYGYASPLHGIEFIINAAKICSKDSDIKFVLLGNGQTRRRDIELSKKLNLQNIEFLPSMKEESAVKIVSKADVILGVFKGNEKSLRVIPNKVYQGIAMAKPVITEDSKAIREVFVDKENIYLCKPADSKSLAEAILNLKSDKTLRKRIAENGYKLYISRFTPKEIGRDLVKIINATLNGFDLNLNSI